MLKLNEVKCYTWTSKHQPSMTKIVAYMYMYIKSNDWWILSSLYCWSTKTQYSKTRNHFLFHSKYTCSFEHPSSYFWSMLKNNTGSYVILATVSRFISNFLLYNSYLKKKNSDGFHRLCFRYNPKKLKWNRRADLFFLVVSLKVSKISKKQKPVLHWLNQCKYCFKLITTDIPLIYFACEYSKPDIVVTLIIVLFPLKKGS